MKEIKFIDLFAGMGGTRIGFENAVSSLGYTPKCVFTSEIKEAAVTAYKANFKDNSIHGDITQISSEDIPDFDFLLAGFPCQPFSSAGSRKGFADTRGTLFFEIQRIIEAKKPRGFLLENVEGLVSHDKEKQSDKIGNTLKTILGILEELGYKVSWQVLNASEYGVPQNRKRIYIVGTLQDYVDFKRINKSTICLEDILEKGLACIETDFTKKLLSHYDVNDLHGKAIKDKRGGSNNIHSWDIELKGPISYEQKEILEKLLKERRKKEWAVKKGIDWMDGMPLTLSEIESFMCSNDLFSSKKNIKALLDDLVEKGYLKYEYPKKLVQKINDKGILYSEREYDITKEKGYNIITGKLSFEITEILDPKKHAPTLVAMDANKLAVVDGKGIRKLSNREGLRLLGYPETYNVDMLPRAKVFDLLGNTVVVPVIEKISIELLKVAC